MISCYIKYMLFASSHYMSFSTFCELIFICVGIPNIFNTFGNFLCVIASKSIGNKTQCHIYTGRYT